MPVSLPYNISGSFYTIFNGKKIATELTKHIEEYAAAFVLMTKLPPDRVVMMVQFDLILNGYRIWFEERKINE